MAAMADGYDRSNAASPEERASQYPQTDPNVDPNAPRRFNVIRNGNQIYGTGANQGSGLESLPIRIACAKASRSPDSKNLRKS